jgi:hypothetical protein
VICSPYTWSRTGQTYSQSGTYRIRINCTIFTLNLVVGVPVASQGIAGPATACRNSTVTYSIPSVTGASSYQWTLPSGATGTSTTNTITVNFSSRFRGGQLAVVPVNRCGSGAASTLNVALANSVPSGQMTITGPAAPAVSGTYSVNAIARATSYAWSVNNPAVSIVSGQGTTSIQLQVQPGFTGTFILGVTASNCLGNGTRATKAITVSTAAREMASVEANEKLLTVYPNPNSGVFTLRTSPLPVDARVEIYSMDGRLVQAAVLPANTSEMSLELDRPAAGLYQVRLVAGDEVKSVKLIIQ